MCGKIYFYCNRSGHFQSRSTGQRHIKTQGSSKIGLYCTAAITASRENISGMIQVQVYKTHYGHTTSLGHTVRVKKTFPLTFNAISFGFAKTEHKRNSNRTQR